MMTVKEIAAILHLEPVAGGHGMDALVTGGYASDLLSDVIGNAVQGNIWITVQTHINIIAVAALKDLSAIVIVRGLVPDKDTIEKSNNENITLLSTELDTFTIAGKLFELLKKE
jgi:predicted transcriptional regulator